MNPDQARVIVRSMDRLPCSGEFAVDPEQLRAAEAHLVGLAARRDARELEVLGARIFEVVAPDLAEAYEGRLLEAQEAAAARKTSLTMNQTPDGLCRGSFAIPALHGAIPSKTILGWPHPPGPTTSSSTTTCPPRSGTGSGSPSSSKPFSPPSRRRAAHRGGR